MAPPRTTRERGLWEAAGKTGVAASRMRHGARLLAMAPAYKFVLGRDTAKSELPGGSA